MDADRFDHLSRSFAERTTRRRAFFAGGGLLAALGLSRAKSLAQDDTATCVLDLVAGIRLGPTFDNRLTKDGPFEVQGQLRFAIGEQGRLVDGKFHLGTNEYPAVGQVAGPAVTIRIAIAPEQTLVLVGAGENALRSCNGDVDGMLTGPLIGDLGDWHAIATTTESPQGDDAPTEAPGVVTVGSTAVVPPASTQTPTPSATVAPTQTPTLEPTVPGSGDVACIEYSGPCNALSVCCEGACEGGYCFCLQTGSACTEHTQCCGYCDFQDGPGVCNCVETGGECARVNSPRFGIGGCCSGSCLSDNTCS